MSKDSLFPTRSLVTMALFTACLCVSAYLSIPLPNGSHISLLSFVLLLVALTFPLKQSAAIVLAWFLLGFMGVPVFAGGAAGLGYITSQWGGYSFAFLAVSLLLPALRKLSGGQYHRAAYTLFAILGSVLIDVIGSCWIMLLGGLSPAQAFAMGFLPFIPLDLVKSVASAQIVPQFHRLLREER